MPSKPHLKLNVDRQGEESVPLKFNYGFGENPEDEDDTQRDYTNMANAFGQMLGRFTTDRQRRIEDRNPELDLPEHVDYIRIRFHGQFVISDFYQSWYNDFGLMGVNFSRFNYEVLFAITDETRFREFFRNIDHFVRKEVGGERELSYSRNILYMQEFSLLTTTDILQFRDGARLLNFRLINLPLENRLAAAITERLILYLQDRDIDFRLSNETGNLEVYNIDSTIAREIAANFDIVLSVTSALGTVVRPSELNVPERTYGFEIANGADELPLVGILDTGISNATPLATIMVRDETFNLTTSSVFEDRANDGYGHGTAVAALASLGKTPYTHGYRGMINADAKLLSMKILDDNSGYLSELALLQMLRDAKSRYPDLKIFVLTTCYSEYKNTNEDYSTYAYELDKFAHENDCLIFICTGNNNDINNIRGYDLNYFFGEQTNICVPAESMNNMIVGAAANGLKDEIFRGISDSKEYPPIYSRKSHIDLSKLYPINKQNNNYFRPDIIECGGDYEQNGRYLDVGPNATMSLLSANPRFGYYEDIGTSFATALAANTALKIQRQYPGLRAQSIKALMVNAASCDNIRFDKAVHSLLNKTAGHGVVDTGKSVLSDDNSITFVLENEISPGQVKVIPLNFPRYLTEEDLGKSRGLIQLTATLCFSFEPMQYNQLAYCPIHMAFSVFRNQTADQIQSVERETKSKLREGWSQNGRYRSKPIPYINTQKMQFSCGVQELEDESSVFKIAVNCRVNPQLLEGTATRYQVAHPYSLVIRVEEKLPESKLTGRLYAEMEATNQVINIVTAEGLVEGLAEA